MGVDAQLFLVSSTSFERCFFGVCLVYCMVFLALFMPCSASGLDVASSTDGVVALVSVSDVINFLLEQLRIMSP